MKMRPESIRHIRNGARNFLRREVQPAPSTASPPIGNHMAKKMPFDCGTTDAVVAAVVLTVSVEVPAPPATGVGLNEHVGARVTTGVMALHDRATLPLKPFCVAIVMVEVPDAPAEIVAGENADAATVKSDPVTIRLSDLL